MKYSILHITDLHLNQFEGTKEHLRKRFYAEYIDGLVETIKQSGKSPNCIVISGDFIDKGKVENFNSVKEIIFYLIEKLKISSDNVCVCIGNHDFKYKEEDNEGKNSKDLRKPFYDFAENFNKNIIASNDRASLYKLQDKKFYLSIDSTLGSHLEHLKGKPGDISEEEIDVIVTDIVKNNVPEESLLMIGCHYPIVHFQDGFAEVDEPEWTEKHMWKKAAFLRNRINKIPNLNKIWFMGDTHFPDQLVFESAYFLMTGRFGGTTEIMSVKEVSHISRQCKILEISEDNLDVFTYNFEMKTHVDTPMYGTWTVIKSDFRVKDELSKKNEIQIVIQEEKQIDLIKDDIEEKIIERITTNGLYSFGRFKTSEDHTSLGWVSINQLLNDTNLLANIVSKSLARIIEKVSCKRIDCILLGLDFWGTIISSQVSVRSGIQNFTIPTRGNGQYNTTTEIDNMLLRDRLSNVKEIVIFIDVVSCGDTINKTIESIKITNKEIQFHVIAVITNKLKYESPNFKNLKSIGSFCKDLKIPILKNEDLPSEQILSANIDFSLKTKIA